MQIEVDRVISASRSFQFDAVQMQSSEQVHYFRHCNPIQWNYLGVMVAPFA